MTRTGFVAVLACTLAGCTVTFGDAGPSGPSRTSGPSTAPACDGTCVSLSPITAITHAEYGNSVEDVFGVQATPTDLPADGPPTPFTTNVSAVRGDAAPDYERAAARVADAVTLEHLALCPDASSVDAFVTDVGARLYRRPLDDEERAGLRAVYDFGADGGSHAEGLHLLVEALLQSPSFLYRVERGVGSEGEIRPLTSYELAARLASFYWRSTPDAALLASASRDELASDAGLATQIDRMMASPHFERTVCAMAREWLRASNVAESADLDAETVDDMQAELCTYVLSVLRSDDPTLEHLLTEPSTRLSSRLADRYAVAAPSTEWGPAEVPGRAGVLARAVVVAGTLSPGRTRSVRRGLLVRERMLCQTVPGPSPAVQAEIAERQAHLAVDPSWTDRAYVEHLLLEPGTVCASCHGNINPVGFAFEGIDHLGRPVPDVDTSGSLDGAAFDDLEGLEGLLATDPRVSRCVARTWLSFALGRPLATEEQPAADALVSPHGGLDLRDAFRRAPFTDAFRSRRFRT